VSVHFFPAEKNELTPILPTPILPEIARHRVAVFSSNYTLYCNISRRVVQTLEQLALSVEVYSIDGAFLQLARGRKRYGLI
jgi:nucleotidyltransferase/DNA polymerase involved in DNA repair